VVLVGDVDIRPGPDIVADLDVLVSHDVAAPADHAAVADAQDRVRAKVVPGQHPGRHRDLLGDQRVRADRDPLFAEDRPEREGHDRPGSEFAERPRRGGTRAHLSGPARLAPRPVHRARHQIPPRGGRPSLQSLQHHPGIVHRPGSG
jgi:hypothetical protein